MNVQKSQLSYLNVLENYRTIQIIIKLNCESRINLEPKLSKS